MIMISSRPPSSSEFRVRADSAGHLSGEVYRCSRVLRRRLEPYPNFQVNWSHEEPGRAVYTVVYTALQGKFDATLTGMEEGNASSFTKRCVFQLTVQIIEF
jgi:hypothetical protein